MRIAKVILSPGPSELVFLGRHCLYTLLQWSSKVSTSSSTGAVSSSSKSTRKSSETGTSASSSQTGHTTTVATPVFRPSDSIPSTPPQLQQLHHTRFNPRQRAQCHDYRKRMGLCTYCGEHPLVPRGCPKNLRRSGNYSARTHMRPLSRPTIIDLTRG
ncbi:hypothetical protein EJ08DRAFT_60160 [Tothia fuscella]|uniref:Uncharacterized protein n=1 Tax=Tothia fuscella TaxID=1048955 RepID=A0A9P4U1K5_9PEZI|nr:hypothetical protein EJ08DRAFT_60160 [Tothia fuscella]